MAWVYKLKNLTLLSWIGLSLLLLNIGGGLAMFLSEPKLESNVSGYPSLELFYSGKSLELNAQHSAAPVATPTESKKTDPESLRDIDFNRGDTLQLEHNAASTTTPKHAESVQSTPSTSSKPRQFQRAGISSKMTTRMCYEIGPLVLNEDKTKLQNMLEMKGMFASVKYYQTNENLGYWVFIPTLRSRALGRLKVEELKLEGFKNVVLLSRAEPVNAVSLGVFKSERDAHELLLKAQSLGFDVRMDVRSQGVANAWLAVEVDQQRNLDEAGWSALLQNYTGLKRRSVNCL